MQQKKISKQQLASSDTVQLAKFLIGKILIRRIRGKEYPAMIAETEAYQGFDDRASHAHKGRTERNKVMFGQAGYWYVYFVYGTHWMLNIVTGPKDYPAAILIRGLVLPNGRRISGPGRLTKALKINKKINGSLAIPASGLWIEDWNLAVPKNTIQATPRIGVDYAGPVWSKKHWRFVLK